MQGHYDIEPCFLLLSSKGFIIALQQNVGDAFIQSIDACFIYQPKPNPSK